MSVGEPLNYNFAKNLTALQAFFNQGLQVTKNLNKKEILMLFLMNLTIKQMEK